MATYDKYYLKENYFGNPYDELIKFFSEYPKRGKLCDLGAGQGRDSIPLFKMGYSVTSVDISQVGLDQITDACPDINVILSDIYEFNVSGYDFVLLDSMLHFYKNDVIKESGLVKNILRQIQRGAVFVNFMMKSQRAEKIYNSLIEDSENEFEIIVEKYFDYPEVDSTYLMTAIKKI